jgi:hypothetical protein
MPTVVTTARPTLVLPKPSGELVRQTATGANSPRRHEIVWPETTPDYYRGVEVVGFQADYTVETILKSLRTSLPRTVKPFVMLTHRSDGYGTTFTLVLHDTRTATPRTYAPLSDFGVSATMAWEYIACDFLRRCFLGSSPIKLNHSAEHFNSFLNAMLHFSALHDSLGAAIIH